MEYPPEMAASLICKWRDLSTVLVISVNTPQLSVSTGGTVTLFEPDDGIQISMLAVKSFSGEVTSAPGEITVLLKDATFRYVDSSEAPPDVRAQSVEMFTGLLSIIVSDTLVLTLTEMRDQPDIEGETTVN